MDVDANDEEGDAEMAGKVANGEAGKVVFRRRMLD